MPTGPRAYGVGAFGVGPYSRWGAVVYSASAQPGISFGVTARPRHTMSVGAASGVTFGAQAQAQRVMPVAASTGIVFTAAAPVIWSWSNPMLCETGTWTLTALPSGPPNGVVLTA